MAFSSTYKVRYIPNLRTGLNTRYDASEIADTDMAACENVEIDTRSIRNAAGYVDYGGNTGPFHGGFHAKFSNGTNRLIRQRGTILEYDNGSGTWTTCTLPTAGSPAATITLSEIPCSMEMLNDTVLWSNGTDSTMSSTDGITWIIPTTGSPAQELPKARKLFNNGLNRILFMAIPSAPSIVWFSDINQPTTVGTNSYQYINPNDGEEIMDAVLLPTGGMLLNKTTSFYQISDITLGIISVDPVGVAPCVRHTAVATENSAIWAGPDGEIYEFSGGLARRINNNIAPLGITQPYYMRAVYHNKKYRLSVPNGSDSYNSYEYVVDRNILTGVEDQPYAITVNSRNIGCYILEDREVSNTRRSRVYFGDGRSNAVGSPAAVPTTFAYINDTHNTGVTQGLDGVAQTCTFTTKFFTEDVPFFVKRYVNYFTSVRASSDQTITLSYRTDPYVGFTDVDIMATSSTIDWEYDNGETGTWNEGYAWGYEALSKIFQDIEKDTSNPTGIQFKLTWSSINDTYILDEAYKFLTNRNFR